MAYKFIVSKERGSIPGLKYTGTTDLYFFPGKKVKDYTNGRSYSDLDKLRKDVYNTLIKNGLVYRSSAQFDNLVSVYRGNQEYATIKFRNSVQGPQVIYEIYGKDSQYRIRPDGSIEKME